MPEFFSSIKSSEMTTVLQKRLYSDSGDSWTRGPRGFSQSKMLQDVHTGVGSGDRDWMRVLKKPGNFFCAREKFFKKKVITYTPAAVRSPEAHL